MEHAVIVMARSLNEAAARGWARFERNGFKEALCGFYAVGELTVTIISQEQRVKVSTVRKWLEREGASEAEQVLKQELRNLFPEPVPQNTMRSTSSSET